VKTMKLPVPILALAAASACTGNETPETDVASDSVAAEPAGGMEGMPMPNSPLAESGMSDEMRSHMDAMLAATGDSLKAMVPMHRQAAANMLAQMNREMSQMNMTPDAAWTATVDSLRQDLTQMPEMSPDELRSALPGHQSRMSRLADLHRAMMTSMKM
jgi:hypothetical protein